MEKIVERVKSILLSPKDALNAVKTEELTIVGTMKEYVAIIAAIPAVALFIGYGLIGLPLVGRYHIGRTLIFAVLYYVLSLVGVFVISKIFNVLAPTFNAVKNDLNAYKLAVYCLTPGFIAGGFNVIPALQLLAWLGAIYGIYLLYLGIPILMEAPQVKTVPYTIVTAFVAFVLMIIIWNIAGKVAWGGGAMPVRYF